jgi:hypothetical protein
MTRHVRPPTTATQSQLASIEVDRRWNAGRNLHTAVLLIGANSLAVGMTVSAVEHAVPTAPGPTTVESGCALRIRPARAHSCWNPDTRPSPDPRIGQFRARNIRATPHHSSYRWRLRPFGDNHQMFYAPNMPTRYVRILLFFGAAIQAPAGLGLILTGPRARLTILGAILVLANVAMLSLWWYLRPKVRAGKAAQLQRRDALLAIVATALIEAGVALFLSTTPAAPFAEVAPALAVTTAGIGCLIARIFTAVRLRTISARR